MQEQEILSMYVCTRDDSRTVLLMKHQANSEYRNYSEVVPPLMYTLTVVYL